MIIGYKKLNNRNIFIVSISELFDINGLSKMHPTIVLFSARCNEQYKIEAFQAAIFNLMDLNCKYFLCYGNYAENLHDKIDDLIYMYDYENDFNKSVNVLTTYHVDECFIEVFNFILYYMVDGIVDFNVVIVVDEKCLKDVKIIKYIDEI